MGKGVVAWIVAAACLLMPMAITVASESNSDALGSNAPAAASGKGDSLDAAPMRVSMEFQDANLKDVLKTFSKQTGINLIAGKDVSDELVTIFLENVTVMDAKLCTIEAVRTRDGNIPVSSPLPHRNIPGPIIFHITLT